jgi:hypothetical protein
MSLRRQSAYYADSRHHLQRCLGSLAYWMHQFCLDKLVSGLILLTVDTYAASVRSRCGIRIFCRPPSFEWQNYLLRQLHRGVGFHMHV